MKESEDRKEEIKINKPCTKIKGRILGGIAVGIGILILVGALAFRTKTVTYEGNIHISDEQLTRHIFGDKLPNSLIYKFFGGRSKTIPYVESYDVSIKKPDVLHITIHEKQIVGYVEYMGNNVYIDNYGKVVDSTSEVFEDIPRMEGLEFDKMVIDEVPEAKNQTGYKNIIAFASAYHKYGLKSGSISVDGDGNTTIKIGNISAACGKPENAEQKVARLNRLLPQMSDLKGVLHLEDFDGSQKDIYFTKSEG